VQEEFYTEEVKKGTTSENKVTWEDDINIDVKEIVCDCLGLRVSNNFQ
jgi:hypothetical protein